MILQKKLPKTLITAINRLANEELRAAAWARAKALRSEYAARVVAGESIETLTHDVNARMTKAIFSAQTQGGK